MNKSEFITLVEHPENLGKSHVPALKNIAADFPFFQANQFLLAKALFNENHYEFEKQLRSTALLVTDREILYHFLHGIESPEIFEKQDEITKVIESLNIEIIEETKDETEIISMPGEGQEKEVLETEIDVPREMPDSPESAPGEDLDEEEETEEPETEEEEHEEEKHEHELHSFDEWIQLFGNKKIKTSKGFVEIKVSENISEEEKITEEKETKPRSNIPQFESILDKFIRENPSISRPKADFYNPANMAKHGAEEDEDLVSETLANIYFQQGAYKKAIRAYEKLCLIYPHKLTYFADLIQKIKELNHE